MSAVGRVYRVRTEPMNDITFSFHAAKKGSLVVITKRHHDGCYTGQAVGYATGRILDFTFRPCDLQKVEYDDEVNN